MKSGTIVLQRDSREPTCEAGREAALTNEMNNECFGDPLRPALTLVTRSLRIGYIPLRWQSPLPSSRRVCCLVRTGPGRKPRRRRPPLPLVRLVHMSREASQHHRFTRRIALMHCCPKPSISAARAARGPLDSPQSTPAAPLAYSQQPAAQMESLKLLSSLHSWPRSQRRWARG